MHDAKNILLPTDFSDNAKIAFPTALALARQSDATLHLCHVIPSSPPAAYRLLDEGKLPPLGADLRQRADEELGKIAADLDHAKVQRHVLQGRPAAEIEKLIERLGIDLVAIATKGQSGLTRFMLGSVTEKVVRTAPCPVLVAREVPVSWDRFTKIIVPTDFGKLANVALGAAVRLAEPSGAPLVLVHVLEETDYPMGHVLQGHGVLDMREQTRKAVRMRLTELVQEQVPASLSPTIQVVDGVASATIADVAMRENADLIVVATHGREGLRRFFLGSTAERLARIAPCSVLVVKRRA